MSSAPAFPAMHSCGHLLDDAQDKLGVLTSTHNALANIALVRERMEQDGYLLLRDHLDKEEVLAARRHILEQLSAEDQLDPRAPLMDGIPKPDSQLWFRPALAQKNNPPLQNLLYSPAGSLMRFFAAFLGGPILHFDQGDRCTGPSCYKAKVQAHVAKTIAAKARADRTARSAWDTTSRVSTIKTCPALPL